MRGSLAAPEARLIATTTTGLPIAPNIIWAYGDSQTLSWRNGLDLRQLRYLEMLAETRNFHSAAKRLNISQPPISVAIRKLEEELGAPLFVRSPGGLMLTEAGAAALEPARKALFHAGQVRAAVEQTLSGERAQLVVGFVGSATFELLPRLIHPFRARYPLVKLILEEGASARISEGITSGVIDIGLVRLPLPVNPELTTHVLELDQFVAALPVGHHLSERKTLRIEDMKDEPFIVHGSISILHETVLALCRSAGFVPIIGQEATQIQTILSLVQSGLGVALVPARSRRFAPAGVVIRPLSTPTKIELGIVHLAPATAAVARFVEMALGAD